MVERTAKTATIQNRLFARDIKGCPICPVCFRHFDGPGYVCADHGLFFEHYKPGDDGAIDE